MSKRTICTAACLPPCRASHPRPSPSSIARRRPQRPVMHAQFVPAAASLPARVSHRAVHVYTTGARSHCFNLKRDGRGLGNFKTTHTPIHPSCNSLTPPQISIALGPRASTPGRQAKPQRATCVEVSSLARSIATTIASTTSREPGMAGQSSSMRCL